MGNLLRRAGEARPRAVLGWTLLSVAAIGWVDFVSGPKFGLSLFYAVPIFLAANRAGPAYGATLAIASLGAWTAAQALAEPASSSIGLLVWNAVVRGVFFFVLVALSLVQRRYADERRAASTDHLTGIANRRKLEEVLARELARVRRSSSPLTLAYVDCDNFKSINDRLGHAVGDKVLRAVAATLAGAIREVDLAARLGGDEFVVLLADSDLESAHEALQRIRGALGAAMREHVWPVTFSVGAITAVADPGGSDTLLEQADRLMYRAKAGGKNAIVHETVGARAESALTSV